MSRGRRKRGSKSKRASAVLKTGFETPILNEPAEFMTMKELAEGSMKKKSNNYNSGSSNPGFVDGSTVGSTPHPADLPYNEAIKQLDAAALKQMDLAAKKAEEAWNTTRVTASAPSYGYPDDTDSLEPSY